MAFFRHTIHVVTTLLLVAVPGLIAFDCGGFLPWSHWLLSVLAILFVILVTVGHSEDHPKWDTTIHGADNDVSHRHADSPLSPPMGAISFMFQSSLERLMHWTPLILILVFAAVSLLQTLSLDASVVRWLSPASADVFQHWLPKALGIAAPDRFTVSVSPWLTNNFTSRAIILAAFAFVGGRLMTNRHFVIAMMIGLALTGLLHAAAGYYQQAVSPGVNLFGVTRIGRPFGPFVNRANAGAMLNLGLAAAIGLLSARLHGRWDYPRKRQRGFHGSFRRLIVDRVRAILLDRPSLLISFGIVFIVSAILACGSRGALMGLVAGTIACAICAVSTQKLPLFLVASVGVGLMALMTLGKTGIEATSLERFLETSESITRDNARLRHWPDGLRAATSSLPLGGGMGAYQYTYLPFQQTGGPNWFLNADNQWVEWFTEGGLPIAGAMLVALFSAMVALRRLLEASDPANRGLAIAGVFAIAAIGISQTFDFALTASSIALAATLLAAAIHARAAKTQAAQSLAAQMPHAFPKPRIDHSDHVDRMSHASRIQQVVRAWIERFAAIPAPFRYWSGRIAVAVVFLGMLAWAQHQTRREAMAYAVVRNCKLQLADDALDYPTLLELEQRVDRAIDQARLCDPLLIQQCLVQRRLFRIERIGRLLDDQPISAAEAVRRTSLELIRVNESLLGDPPLSDDPRLRRITDLSRQTLQRCPLSETALWNLAQLDFSEGYRSRTPAILEQLSRLRCRNGDILAGIAATAWQMGEKETAAQAWKQLLLVDAKRLPKVFQQLSKTEGAIRLSQVLPDEIGSDDNHASNHRQLLLNAARLQNQLPADQQDPIVRARALKLLQIPISPAERELKKELEEE
ncbi:O-Antigen ligase [Planctomycetes bacterium CA13]|uniref:O-Antigen ligase n=1 Tax=Novipirellula herctigrandis TaxID=2527986 RepID=A0A5C5YZH9_9BACT|nr:O-Antigen ligase [Planctomycetes bacterium CA13]